MWRNILVLADAYAEKIKCQKKESLQKTETQNDERKYVWIKIENTLAAYHDA